MRMARVGRTQISSSPNWLRGSIFFKGPYFPAIGDFSGAGAAEFKFFKTLPQDILTLEYGENDYFRALFAQTLVLRSSDLPSGIFASDRH